MASEQGRDQKWIVSKVLGRKFCHESAFYLFQFESFKKTYKMRLGCTAHFRFRPKLGKCERKQFRLEPKKLLKVVTNEK